MNCDTNHNSSNTRLCKGQQVQILMRPLYDLLAMHEVTELTINKPFEVWTKTSHGWALHQLSKLSYDYLRSLAIAIITFNNMQPKNITSVILPNNERGQIVMPPACLEGTLSISIRKHAPVVKTLTTLEQEKAFSKVNDVSFNQPTLKQAKAYLTKQDFTRLEQFEIELLHLKAQKQITTFLQQAILYKRNIVIAGKTGSGKTTFARSLIQTVPTHERIITIEDVHELFLDQHPNKVHLLYGDSPGQATANDCLKSCMRQSPDRIFLAELRADEAWEYLNSLNTGHPGSVTTVHANSCLQTFDRISNLIKNSKTGTHFDTEAVKQLLYSTIDVVLFVQNFKLIQLFYDPIFAKQQ